MMKVKAIIYEAEEGGYWAKATNLPGLYTQGESLEELEANLREAVDLYLSVDEAGPFLTNRIAE
jgi:predicted RNase H-like HicB family nuclease